MRNLLLLILALLTPPAPTLTASWQTHTALHVTWTAPGWHCVYLEHQSVDCRENGADLLLPTGGVDHLYAPKPGQTLRLIGYSGVVEASVAVPSRVYTVILNWVRR